MHVCNSAVVPYQQAMCPPKLSTSTHRSNHDILTYLQDGKGKGEGNDLQPHKKVGFWFIVVFIPKRDVKEYHRKPQ